MVLKPTPKPRRSYENKIESTLPQHWNLLARIVKAHNDRNIMLRDELMIELAIYTGSGVVES